MGYNISEQSETTSITFKINSQEDLDLYLEAHAILIGLRQFIRSCVFAVGEKAKKEGLSHKEIRSVEIEEKYRIKETYFPRLKSVERLPE